MQRQGVIKPESWEGQSSMSFIYSLLAVVDIEYVILPASASAWCANARVAVGRRSYKHRSRRLRVCGIWDISYSA